MIIKKKVFINGPKSIWKKIGFAAVFIDIAKRWALTEEASIHTAKKTETDVTLNKIHKRKINRI